jgi:hypothetical protein
MLKKETIQKIAGLLKIKEADLETALKDEKEVDVTIEATLQTFTETEVATLKTNEYNSGKVKGVEMAVKETKEKLGLEFQGKTIEGLLTAAQKKAIDDAKIEPNKKVEELNEKLTNAQNSYKELETKLKAKETEVQNTKIKTDVFKYIPAFGDEGPAFDQEDVYHKMLREGYEFKEENGKTVAYLNGKQVIDKVSNPVEMKDVVTGFLKEKKLISETDAPKGRGGGNGAATSKFASLSEVKAHFQSQGKSLNGQEFSEAVNKAAADNKEFAMDK